MKGPDPEMAVTINIIFHSSAVRPAGCGMLALLFKIERENGEAVALEHSDHMAGRDEIPPFTQVIYFRWLLCITFSVYKQVHQSTLLNFDIVEERILLVKIVTRFYF